ncbi:MAG: hypothetical protein JXA37_09000 [Chloroflexia bacterium]|nr:hypothetical protein [Chloroflexia bacterium]
MLYLLFIALPLVVALYTFLLGQQRKLLLWAALTTIVLESYLCANLPLEQPIRLLGATLALSQLERLFLYVFLLLAGVVLLVAQELLQGDFPVPIGLFILGVTNTIVLLDDRIVIVLLLEVVGLAIVLGTVDRPQEPVGLLPVSALMAGLKYLIMMTLAGIALVMGFLLLDLYVETPDQLILPRLALGLVVTGFGLSAAVAPFHLWFADLAGHTSTAVTGLLVSLVQGAGLLFLAGEFQRLPWLLQQTPRSALWLSMGAILAGLLAALLANGQRQWKRLAAYAASFDVALILYSFGLASPAALQTGLFLTIHHGLALTLLLACVGVLEWSTGRDDVAGLVGVAYRMPLVALGLVVATLSLAGIPPFGGFVGRWLLLVQAQEQGWPFLAGLLVATALLLLAMVRALWPTLLATDQTVALQKPSRLVLWVIGLLIVGLLLLGLYPNPVLQTLRAAIAG